MSLLIKQLSKREGAQLMHKEQCQHLDLRPLGVGLPWANSAIYDQYRQQQTLIYGPSVQSYCCLSSLQQLCCLQLFLDTAALEIAIPLSTEGDDGVFVSQLGGAGAPTLP